MKGNDSKDSALNSEHDMIINLTSPTEESFLPSPFKLPRVSIKQHPRKNRFRFQYKMGKSWIFDTSTDNSLHSPNSNLDYDSCIYKSIRILSRSAKIMRALSSTSSSFRDKDVGIRKLLNFDSTPSPKENSNYENSSSINTDTPSSTLNSSLTDSTDSNIPTMESIDENQNRTPQQNRKYLKVSSRVDIKENMCVGSRTAYLMSLLENERKEETNKEDHEISFHPFCSFNPFNNGSNGTRVIIASTPRNLAQEFDQEIQNRPHTLENMANIIPESISAIKKSHKKEKLYCHEEQSSIQKMDVSVKNDDLCPRTVESLKIKDVIAETSATAENESQKKNRNTKRTLIYNDECPDIKSDLDHSMQQETTSTGTDLLGSELKSNEMQDIDSSDCENHENMQVSINLVDNEEEDHSMKDVCNEEVNELFLQNESSNLCNVSATSENRMASPESNPIISQNSNKVVTPENHADVLTHMFSESIKKSHKKIKHENRKKLFKSEDRQEMELENEISLDVCNDDQNIKNQTTDVTCASSSQNFENDRPSTPENFNSSRLLLHDFSSVKKLHKKNKHSKRNSSFTECYDYEYHKRNNDSLQNNSCKEENVGAISCMNESIKSLESPGMSPKKKKKSTSMFLQSSTPKMPSALVSLGCKSIDEEFKIYTPIKKRSILLTITDYVPADEMLQETGEPAQSISNEIDCSRCVTPIARFKELKKNKDLSLERGNATGFETDIIALKAVDTANLEDKNGRLTPINMSTTELLHNINSIKKSHKKDKHNRSKRPISEKKRKREKNVSFTNSGKMLEERIALSLSHVDDHCTEKEICNVMREKEKNNSYKEIDYDDPQPSTSREGNNIENVKNTTISKFLNTTPPNSLSAMNFIKLLHTTSIKKSHKKERDMNAQTKYIFMSQEHELSDDGSIFDEEDRLSFINDNNTEIKTII